MKKLSPVLLVLFAACSHTTIVPKINNEFLIVASSSSSSYALESAVKDATKHCTELKKSFIMVDQKTEYQGADKNLKVAIEAVAAASAANSKGMRNVPAGNSNEDYRVEMTFRCQ